MVASLTNIKLAPNLVLECLLYIHKPSISASIKSQRRQEDQQQQPFESAIASAETQTHTAIIRLLNKTHDVRISDLQTQTIIDIFRDSIIEMFKTVDLAKLQQANELRIKTTKPSDQFVQTFSKEGYTIRVSTKYALFMKILDDYLITDYILIRTPKESKMTTSPEPQILIEEEEGEGEQGTGIRAIPEAGETVEVEEEEEDEEEDKKPIQEYEYQRLKLLKSLRIYVLEVPMISRS